MDLPVSSRGLNVRKLGLFNEALLDKWRWQFASKRLGTWPRYGASVHMVGEVIPWVELPMLLVYGRPTCKGGMFSTIWLIPI